MRQIGWFDPELGEASHPVRWPAASLLLATVFLNPIFVEVLSGRFWPNHPLPIHAAILAAIALATTMAFYMGPALAAQASARSVFEVAAGHLGTIPSYLMRAVVLLFLPLWVSTLVGVPLRFAANSWRPEPSSLQVGLMAAGILALVFVTAHQTEATQLRLALFSSKLFVAIAIAAFVRVHDGWPAILDWDRDEGAWKYLQFGISDLANYAAPLVLLAADFSSRAPARGHVHCRCSSFS